jgi:hypothetical protein
MRISEPSPNEFNFSGTASMNGTARSMLTFRMDGKRVDIPIARGDTAQGLREKIERALPKGYDMRVIGMADHIGGNMIFTIGRKGEKPVRTRVESPEVRFGGKALVTADNQVPPLWYSRWKSGGKGPSKADDGKYVIGPYFLVVKNGKLNGKASGIFPTTGGIAVVVEKGKVVGWQG